ncbi:MAG: glycosyltransferase [Flavobacteriales bacterium]|nr:glycosyltransferase [Flavobacteriales bacterium]
MKLSIIIVNYNVKYFLQQCLTSVFAALNEVEAEVFVVDNNSMDGSCDMVRANFPNVKLIESKENLGFSKGNNLAINKANGKYILLLNPDTLVEEVTFTKVIEYMDSNSDVGGLGVKIVDGKGRFLPESKRGLPTPEVAFYKIFGLAALFPTSRRFGAYHLTYLDKNKTHEIDILSGAFMLMRKETLDKVGLLDESFFMYGEDIDLSYRIQEGGYKNVYFPETKIIHYKGESTKKTSVNYVFVFYNAMIIFAKKHFSDSNAGAFSIIINLAIYFRAVLALSKRLISQLFLPLIDFVGLVSGLFIAKEIYHLYTNIPYQDDLVGLLFPIYGFIWVFTNFLLGGYDKPINLINNLKGVLIGSASVLIFYSLLDESIRFSRALTLIGCGWAVFSTTISRIILHLFKLKEYQLLGTNKKRIVIVGSSAEVMRVTHLLNELNMDIELFIPVLPANSEEITDTFQLPIDKLNEGKKLFGLNELIFCSKDVSNTEIIQNMEQFSNDKFEYKIAPADENYIVGSNSIDASGDIYKLLELNSINSSENKRKKQIFDILTATILLLLFPIWIGKTNNVARTFFNLFKALTGSKSVVGYNPGPKNTLLPQIKSSILSSKDISPEANLTVEILHNQNIKYAKNYSPKIDFNILIKSFKSLGN